MTRTGTMLVAAAALAIGAVLGGGGLVQARLGPGADAIGGWASDVTSSGAPQSVAPAVTGQCITNRTAFKTQTNEVSTQSQTFVAMLGSHFPVTHTAGCLIVDFAGEVAPRAALAGTQGMHIRAFIKGIGAANPPLVFLGRAVEPTLYEARSMRFVFPNVPAGTHTVRIDWLSESGGTVSVRNRMVTVQYR